MTVRVARDNTKDIEFDRLKLTESLAALATNGVFVGTSSWKYQGWLDQLYTRTRYEHEGKINDQLFKSGCLREYGEVFKTVGVDSSYYAFPNQSVIFQLSQAVPDGFLFALKASSDVTIKKYPQQPRFGKRAGQLNEHFLDASLFEAHFLTHLRSFPDRVGLIMFEFSRFYPTDFAKGRDFVQVLDQFFSKLPKGWPYGVEIRNKHFLHKEYFEMLATHGVVHVFNSWADMPDVGTQMAIPGSFTNARLTAARFLLKPGRKYQESVDAFSPYDRVQEVYPEARTAGAKLIREGAATPGRRTFIFVNNRLEGNALGTITGMLEEAERV